MNKVDFIEEYKRTFEKSNLYKIVLEMGDSTSLKQEKIAIIQKRFQEIVKITLGKEIKNIWVVLYFWNSKEQIFTELSDCGIDFKSKKTLEGKQSDGIVNYQFYNPEHVLYAHYESIELGILTNLISGIARDEIALTPSTEAKAYIISLDAHPVLLNLYDDRGMEILTSSPKVYADILEKCGSYIIKKQQIRPS